MPTLKKLNEDRINITSKLLKKDEDFLPISPELIKDLRDKILLENSALKLSINDYKLMCNTKIILNMMSIALNKPKAKLKKFCKYISVFEENIAKSPKSIANKINGPITNLPKEIRSTILDKFVEILPTKYVLLDWIDENDLNWESLSSNPNAIDLLEENKDKINWTELSANPNAIDLIKKKIEYENTLTTFEYNNLYFLQKIDWNKLSSNTNAIEILKNNLDKICWINLSKNPNAIDLIRDRIKYEKTLSVEDFSHKLNWESLSNNPNAIDLLLDNKDKIDWYGLSSNPNAIDLLKERIKYEKSLTKAEYNKLEFNKQINWFLLSANPNAIEILNNNKDKINWTYLSSNSNTALLKKNIKNINWTYLSSNPNAIELLKEQIIYEKTLKKKQYNNLKNKIDWEKLSSNPNAIDLLKNNKDKINWKYLFTNPSIFKAV